MSYKINAFPNINPVEYIKPRKLYDPLLFKSSFFLYASGRAALYHAIKAASLPENSRVLMPAFHCGVEVEAVKRAGYEVDFYNIDRELTIDFDDLKRRINKQTSILVVIHYFGFPQDMDKLLEFSFNHNLLLFEDCAHALYSSYRNKLLGSMGAFGIFSLQKTIALPNGGGLLCNMKELMAPSAGDKYIDLSLLKSTLKSILEYKAESVSIAGKISLRILNMYESCVSSMDDNVNAAEPDMRWYYDVARYDYHNTISALSRPLLSKESFETIVEKRRGNYLSLRGKLQDMAGSDGKGKELEDGVCPLCYVVSVEDRDEIVKEMNEKNIFPFVFGRFPHKLLPVNDFQDAKYLSKHLIGLPIHQRLGEKDIEIIADTYKRVVEKLHGNN